MCPDPNDPIVPWPSNANRELVVVNVGTTPTYYTYITNGGVRATLLGAPTTNLSSAGITCPPTAAMVNKSWWYSITTGPSTTLYLGQAS